MHKNNFDFLRLLFAVLVIITHSYVLTGAAENDGLHQLTRGQMTFSALGVYGFFTISGYLIFQSAMNSKNLLDYCAKRILRIYPAFIVVLLVGILIGWLVTTRSTSVYFSQRSTWQYFTQNIAMLMKPQQFGINGVFGDNPNHGINGSLWTIPYELFFYIVLAAILLVRRYRTFTLLSTGALLAICMVWAWLHRTAPEYWTSFHLDVHQIARFGIFFMSGSLLAALKIEQFRYKIPLLLLLCILLAVSIPASLFGLLQYLTVPAIILLFGTMNTTGLSGWNARIGDLSYGIYLYAFPIQQLLVHYFHPGYLVLMCCTIPLTAACAVCSWKFIEERSLGSEEIPQRKNCKEIKILLWIYWDAL